MAEPAETYGTPEAVMASFNHPGLLLMTLEGPDLLITGVNETATAFAGRELLGRPYTDVLPDVAGQGWGEILHQVFDTGRSVRPGEPWRIDFDQPEAGLVTIYASLSVHPWFADDGTVRGVLARWFDVTQEVRRRHRAEAESEASERRYHEAQGLVLALQDSLLPDALPVVPGLQTAGRYLLAQEDTAAGGDWLDVIPLDEGRVALVVGDVVGHGVRASALMGQLRAVLSERLAAGAGLVASLEALDRVAGRQPAAHATTVVVAEVDPTGGRIRYCTAGHPPPLLVSDGEARFVAPSGARPLATDGRFPVAEERLEPGDQLLLYTDGLIERPGRTPAQATVELTTVVERVTRGKAFRSSDGLPVDRTCEQVLELLTRETGYADDITLVAAQRVELPEPLEVVTQAQPESLQDLRRAVAGWLEPLAVRSLDEMVVQHVVGEVVTNVIDHAYRDRPEDGDRPLRLTVEAGPPGTATVTVVDRGSWRYGARDQRGRGLQMVNTMCDQLTIDRQPEGTTVTLTCPLSRSVILMQGGAPGSGGGTHDDAFGVDQDHDLVKVHGAVDTVSADDLRVVLLRSAAGRLPEVRVDLSLVTLLASAGVQVLYDALGRADEQGISLRLVAAPGSVAQHVLDLVGLPHEQPGGPEQNGPGRVES